MNNSTIEFIYCGPLDDRRMQLPPVRNVLELPNKPKNVLWTSPYNPKENKSEWLIWSENNFSEDRIDVYKETWYVVPDENCRILEITPDSHELDKYIISIRKGQRAIDYEAIAEHYDALYIPIETQIDKKYKDILESWSVSSCVFFHDKYNLLTPSEYELYKRTGKIIKKRRQERKKFPIHYTKNYKVAEYRSEYFAEVTEEGTEIEVKKNYTDKDILELIDDYKKMKEMSTILYDESRDMYLTNIKYYLKNKNLPYALEGLWIAAIVSCEEAFNDEPFKLLKKLKPFFNIQKMLNENLQLNKVHTCKMLLENGAKLNRSFEGYFPIHKAKGKALEFCLQNGCNPDEYDAKGRTKLMYELEIDELENMLQYRANPNIRDRHGRTPLMYAKTPEAIKILLTYGADPAAVDDKGRSVLDYVSHNYCGRKEGINLIKEAINKQQKTLSILKHNSGRNI